MRFRQATPEEDIRKEQVSLEPSVSRRIMYSAFRQSRIICRAFTRDPDDQGYEQGRPTKIQRKRDRRRRQQLYKQRFLKSAFRYLLWVWEAFSVCDAEKIALLSYPNLVLFLENTDSRCPVRSVQKATDHRVIQSRSLWNAGIGKESLPQLSVLCGLSDL